MTIRNTFTQAIAASAVLLLCAQKVNAYATQLAGSGDVIRWDESCFQYSLHSDGLPEIDMAELREAIRASFNAWADVDCSYFYFEETEDAHCDEIGYREDTGNMNLLIFRSTDWAVDKDHDAKAIALTTTSWDDLSGRLLDADLEFNADNFTFGVDGADGKADIQNTATHEIGHMLGLDHSNVEGSTMSPTAGDGDTDKRTLEQDDIDGLCTLYPDEYDPNVCMEPHCGVDLTCNGTTCDPSGIAYPGSDDSDGCTVPVHLGGTPRLSTIDLLSVLFSGMP